MVGSQSSSLGEELNGWQHAVFLGMTQLAGQSMGIVHRKVLVEVKGIEDGNKLYSYQHLVDIVGFGFVSSCPVASEPLEEGLVLFS